MYALRCDETVFSCNHEGHVKVWKIKDFPWKHKVWKCEGPHKWILGTYFGLGSSQIIHIMRIWFGCGSSQIYIMHTWLDCKSSHICIIEVCFGLGGSHDVVCFYFNSSWICISSPFWSCELTNTWCGLFWSWEFTNAHNGGLFLFWKFTNACNGSLSWF